MVLCTYPLVKKVDPMLSVLTTKKKQRNTGHLLEMMDIFITLMVGIVPCVYAYVQISQNVYIKYVQFFCILSITQ